MGQDVNIPTKIIVHHTASGGNLPQFDGVNRYHAQRKFSKSTLGYFVGYHFFIERNGEIKQARAEDEMGQHTTGENRSSIGICLAGNFDYEMPSQEQIEALTKLMTRICEFHFIPAWAIYPHRTFANKSCYGKNLRDDWAKMLYIRRRAGILAVLLERLKDLLAIFQKLP